MLSRLRCLNLCKTRCLRHPLQTSANFGNQTFGLAAADRWLTSLPEGSSWEPLTAGPGPTFSKKHNVLLRKNKTFAKWAKKVPSLDFESGPEVKQLAGPRQQKLAFRLRETALLVGGLVPLGFEHLLSWALVGKTFPEPCVSPTENHHFQQVPYWALPQAATSRGQADQNVFASFILPGFTKKVYQMASEPPPILVFLVCLAGARLAFFHQPAGRSGLRLGRLWFVLGGFVVQLRAGGSASWPMAGQNRPAQACPGLSETARDGTISCTGTNETLPYAASYGPKSF